MSDADKVTVGLTSCSAQDADAVFRALGSVFASDWLPGEPPESASGGHPVWTATFDTARSRGAVEAPVLAEPVTASLQGGYHAVDLVRDELAGAFALSGESGVPGDQEKDVRLHLANRQS
ncbi:hypothetical protein AB0M28_29835 [Streptomyces sp. NPDC051940]|uniref:hypothetical protein n=1 Tax=Streptomyces sp. NPDC051940 TaxID=3155675 RepID=UPI003444AD0D